MTHRRAGRELALQMLFASSFWGEGAPKAGLFMLEKSDDGDDAKAFAKRLFDIIIEHHEEIYKTIESNLQNWKIERVWLVDKCVLQIAVAELLYVKDTPPSVAIDQAVRLAKKFGGDESGRFVNGMLGAVYRKNVENAQD